MKTNSLHSKHLGELAEELFKFIARSLGLIVCKPETQLTRYDFIVDCSGIPGLRHRRSTWFLNTRSLQAGRWYDPLRLAPSPGMAAKGRERQRPTTNDQRQSAQRPKANGQRPSFGMAAPPFRPHLAKGGYLQTRNPKLETRNCPLLRIQVKATSYRQPLRTRRNPKNPNGTRITLTRGAWRINLTCQSGHLPYRRHDFDLLAAYILPDGNREAAPPFRPHLAKGENLQTRNPKLETRNFESTGTWYLIPASELPRRQQILLWPNGPARYSRWEQWRERWDLLCP